jgi:hypothetical protein
LAAETGEQDLIGAVGVYSALSYAALLRGNKGFHLDLFGLRQHILKGKYNTKNPHVVTPLLGRLKGEDGKHYHMLLMASETALGLKIREWLERLAALRERDKEGTTVQLFAMTMERWLECLTTRKSSTKSFMISKTNDLILLDQMLMLNRSTVSSGHSGGGPPPEQLRLVCLMPILI